MDKIMITLEEAESLAYKVWYAKFKSEQSYIFEDIKNKMESEFSMLRKYKATIYQQFEIIKSLDNECRRKINEIDSKSVKYSQILEIERNIKNIERKLSYMMGHPFDKRNLKKELLEENPTRNTEESQ